VRRALPVPGARLLTHGALAVLVFAIIAVPWYMHGVLVHGEAFVKTFLTSGTLGIARFFRPAISTPPPYWLSLLAYVPLLLLGLLPWTPGFIVGLADLPHIMRRGSPGLKIVVAWLFGILIVLSLSSGDKVFRYLLPCYPPAAILAARALATMLAGGRRLRAAAVIAIVPAVALIAAGFWSLWAAFPPERGLLAAVVLPAVVMIAVGLVAFGAAALVGRGRAAVAAAALAAIIGYALFERGMLLHAAAINPWPAMAEAAAPYAGTSSRLVLYGRVGELFNFAHFYFDEPVVTVSATHELSALWRRERVLVIVPADRVAEFATLRPAPSIVMRSPARLLLLINWSPAAP
jgi:4-amino-4-deoxy-L-arabinose transferase-like glycosyltransferase